MFEGLSVFVLVVVVVVVFYLLRAIRMVPQGYEYTVERFGRYVRTLPPGLGLIVPFIDRIGAKQNMMEQFLDIPSQEVITRDNAVILINAIAFIKITDPIKAVYGVTDFSEAIRNMIMTTLRSITGDMDLDEALTSRDAIKARLRESIADEAIDWGLTVKSVEIQDIKPSPSMIKAMEAQAAAERERKAMVTMAEGTKQSTILQAEARLEAARRDAEAQVTLAEASAEAIRRVAVAIGSEDAPMRYMLGERYLAAMGKIAESANAKTIVLPADIQDSLRGILGRSRE